MIITLKKADFSGNHIGTLDTWSIFPSSTPGATYTGVKMVTKGARYSGTVTIEEGYELGTAGITVKMGETTLTNVVTPNANNTEFTISIESVTGHVYIYVSTKNTSSGEDSGNVVFNFDFTTNNIDDYALEDVFTVPSNSTTSAIEYDSVKGMSLNNNLPNGLNLVNPIDASRAWELEFTATFVTPTVLAGNRRSFLGGADLYPFVFINGTTESNMGFQISNGSHATLYGNGVLVYDQEATYKIKYDGNGSVEVYVNNTSKGKLTVNFAGQQFTVMLGNVSGKSSAYVWQNVEAGKKSYLKTFKFKYV